MGFDDLLTLAQHWGAAGADATYANGCMNADGNIGFDDLLLLAQHYGESFPSGATAAVSFVPEPGLAIAVAIVVGLARQGGRGRKRNPPQFVGEGFSGKHSGESAAHAAKAANT